jgi:hypothetical protein
MAADQTYAVIKDISIGDLKMVIGTYANASGSTGGAIATGLNEVFSFNSNCMTSQATTVNKCVISGGTVTMTVVDDEDGQWKAIGV